MEAHVFVAFLGYCLSVTLRMKLRVCAPGLTPRAVLALLAAIQTLDGTIPTTDGRERVLPRYTEPNAEQAMVLEKFNLTLPPPPPPPPRIRAGQVELPARSNHPAAAPTASAQPPPSPRQRRPNPRANPSAPEM